MYICIAQIRKNTSNALSTHDTPLMHCQLMTTFISRVHLMNVEQRQMTADLRTSQPTWAVSPPVGCYCPRLPLPFVTTQPES